jgi:hypothetical protein
MVSELLRVLRPGGRVLVSAWALEQEDDSRRTFDDQDVFVPVSESAHCIPFAVLRPLDRSTAGLVCSGI